jgi:hypothetical protein
MFETPPTWTRGLLALSRCKVCQGSYLTHEGKRERRSRPCSGNKASGSGHMSPFEHPATPMDTATEYYGNFKGWMQYRKLIPGESDPLGTHHD